MEHINITVKGKVQGVWYRQSTLDKAVELGVTGYTKNLINGDVFIEAEANFEILELLLNWCKVGPKNAIVDNVEFTKSKYKGFKIFEIVS